MHDTDAKELLLSMLTGLDQLDPFQESALPPLSTAMQKFELSQERLVTTKPEGSIFEPYELQMLLAPLVQMYALAPELDPDIVPIPIAMQKLEVGHDTSFRERE